MARVTSKELEELAQRVAIATGLDIEVNNAPHYGGWQTTINKGSTVVNHRGTPKECKSFLGGVLFATNY